MTRFDKSRRRPFPFLLGALLVPFLGGCDTFDGDDDQQGSDPGGPSLGQGLGSSGEELARGDGSTVFVDPNSGGSAPELRLAEIFWGRLVDVYDEENGTRTLRHRSYVIGQDVDSDTLVDVDDDASTPGEPIYSLAADPITGVFSLTIGAPKGSLAYQQAFDRLHDGLEPVAPADPSGFGPFSVVARNATLVLHADDLLDPATIVAEESVRVRTGNPPQTPFRCRIFPDPNYGQLFADTDGDGVREFRPTRILVDFTVSELELPETTASSVNNVGLPESPNQQQSNAAILLPTQLNPGAGVFSVVRNLAGQPFGPGAAGPPLDSGQASMPLVAGFRSGNGNDASNGFLDDGVRPRLLAQLDVGVTNVRCEDGDGDCEFSPTFRYLIDVEYEDPFCETMTPEAGDVFEMPGGIVAQVVEDAGPAVAGVFADLLVRDLSESLDFVRDTEDAEALLLAPYEPLEGDDAIAPCFVAFSPEAGTPPNGDVDPTSVINFRFSEPMDPASLSALEDILVVRTMDELSPEDIVVGTMIASNDLAQFSYKPVLPFSHLQGTDETYYIRMGLRSDGLTDLAGNRLLALLPDLLPFTLDPDAPTDENGGFVLRFNDPELDEDPPPATPNTACFGPEITGQFLFDPDRGVLRARPVTRFSMIVDSDTELPPSLMAGIPVDPQGIFGVGPTVYDVGTQEPMVGEFGSRTMAVWRYCDMGLTLNDQPPSEAPVDLDNTALYNVDVEGIAWQVVGSVLSDHFDRFEIALAHSSRFPDEGYLPPPIVPVPARQDLAFGGDTGMRTASFDENALPDGTDEPIKVVHPRDRGYSVAPLDSFIAANGKRMMPYPLNEGPDPNQYRYYTWRDTAIQALGGEASVGLAPAFAGGFDAYLGMGLPPQVMMWQTVGDASVQPTDWTDFGFEPPMGGSLVATRFAFQGAIPSVGMPLLMDFRCFPDSGAGNNQPDVRLAGFPIVFGGVDFPVDFRVTTTGGIDDAGTAVKINPDPELAEIPMGGFNRNPQAPVPFGEPTLPGDGIFYLGQLDLVTRISRAYTRWFDTRGGNVTFLDPVTFPAPSQQPTGTSIEFAYRQASLVQETQGNCPKEGPDNGLFAQAPTPLESAQFLDAYGDQVPLMSYDIGPPSLAPTDLVSYGDPGARNQSVSFLDGDSWKTDVDELAGSPFLQARITFVANPQSSVTPELNAVGWAFDFAD